MRAGLAEAIVVLLAAIVLAVVLTYPLAIQIDRVGRLNTDDGMLSVWNVAWVARTVVVDPRGLFHANIFYPHRNTLAFSESNLGAGLLAVPVWWLTGNPYAAHNTAVLLAFVLSAIATYFLARHLTGHRAASAIAAVAFAYCPYVFARFPHIQLLMTFGIPLSLLAFHRLVDRPSFGRAVALALALAAQALSCAYFGVFAGLVVGLGTLFFAWTRGLWRSVRFCSSVATAAALSLLIVLPFFLPYVELQREAGFQRTLEDARRWPADWRAYLASAAWAHRWMLPLLGSWKEVLFPGFMTTVLGILGAAMGGARLKPGTTRGDQTAREPGATRERAPSLPRDLVAFYTLVAVLAFWASFGPSAGLYTLFFHTIPVFSFLRAPARFGILVTLSLAVLASVAVSRLLDRQPPRARQRVAIGVALLVTIELLQVPLVFQRARPAPDAYRLLAQLPRGPVAEFPFFWQRWEYPHHAEYMLWSTHHWQPLINGYSDYIPPDFREIAPSLNTFPSRGAFEILGRRRARYVVLHLRLYDRLSREALMARLEEFTDYLRPLVREQNVWLYEIVAFPR